jgi:hypothetical protein
MGHLGVKEQDRHWTVTHLASHKKAKETTFRKYKR